MGPNQAGVERSRILLPESYQDGDPDVRVCGPGVLLLGIRRCRPFRGLACSGLRLARHRLGSGAVCKSCSLLHVGYDFQTPLNREDIEHLSLEELRALQSGHLRSPPLVARRRERSRRFRAAGTGSLNPGWKWAAHGLKSTHYRANKLEEQVRCE